MVRIWLFYFLSGKFVMNVGAYWFSDRAVLKMYDAKVIGSDDAPELYTMVDRLRSEGGFTHAYHRDCALRAAECVCYRS
ncbi:MAG: hypothetical protein CM1200mP14_23240 [Gammaproteobacteria bacterium]|nr:MAG: hypothetical protein CM1200mP14_23240 [Gammaproteobacteria bacterium]